MAAPSTAIFTYNGSFIARGVHMTRWTATVSGAGLAQSPGNLPDKTVAISGPTGGTSSVTIQGSNATTPTAGYFTLNSAAASGGPLSTLTAAGIFVILENPRFIRPLCATVTTGKTINIDLLSRSDLG